MLPLPPSTPAPNPIPAPIPSSIPKPPAGPTYFELAELYYKNGDYANAARAYETYLRNNYAPVNQDLALFRLALCHEFPDSTVHNLSQATKLLKELVMRFPDSPYRPQAEVLLDLQGEVEKLRTDVDKRDDRIKELTQELEKLKQIDMERRPTGTPP